MKKYTSILVALLGVLFGLSALASPPPTTKSWAFKALVVADWVFDYEEVAREEEPVIVREEYRMRTGQITTSEQPGGLFNDPRTYLFGGIDTDKAYMTLFLYNGALRGSGIMKCSVVTDIHVGIGDPPTVTVYFTFREQSRDLKKSTISATGSWSVISGTGSYENVSGGGT